MEKKERETVIKGRGTIGRERDNIKVEGTKGRERERVKGKET